MNQIQKYFCVVPPMKALLNHKISAIWKYQ